MKKYIENIYSKNDDESQDVINILEYWFNGTRQTPTNKEMKMWFYKSTNYDVEIKDKFSHLFSNLDTKKFKKSLAGKLALIIIYDQLSRHIYRNDKAAFSYDNKALKLTLKFIEEYDVESNEFLEQILFNPEETEFYIKHFLFMTMPLQHSENLENQNTFKGIWDKLNNKIKEKLLNPELNSKVEQKKYEKMHNFIKNVLSHSEGHINRLKHFGRFPKRNEILGRKNTPEEEYFLKSNKNGHY